VDTKIANTTGQLSRKLGTALLTLSIGLSSYTTATGSDSWMASAATNASNTGYVIPAAVHESPAPTLPGLVRAASLGELLNSSAGWQDHSRSSHLIPFELSPRQAVEKVELDLVFPPDLSGADGGVEIRLNNHQIAKLQASDSDVIAGRVQIVVDASLLATDNNFLQVSFDSEVLLSDALDIERSRMFFEGTWKQLAPNLGSLNAYFEDKTAHGDSQLHLCFPGISDTGHNLESIRWGALASQGLALRMGQLPPLCSQSSIADLSQDNLIIGEARDLSQYLNREQIQKITGPFIAVDALPDAPHRFMIVISGRTAEEVSRAALAFGFIHFGYPHTSSVVVNDISLPIEPVYIRKAPVFAGTTSNFKELGYQSAFHPIDAIPTMEVDFNLDVRAITEDSDVALLQLDYWGPTGNGAAIEFDLEVNGELIEHLVIGAGPGAAPSSDSQHGRGTVTVEMPMAALHAGENRLQIIPVAGQASIAGPPDGARFSIFDSSTIELISSTPSLALPNLDLLKRSGFPFVPRADGANLEVVLANADRATVSSAWTMMAKLAQVTNTFLYHADIRLHSGNPLTDRQTLVIGAVEDLAAPIRATLPITEAELTQRLSNQGGLVQMIAEPASDGEGEGERLPKTLTLLTAIHRQALPQLCQELVRGQNWSRISGDMTTWGSGETLVATQLIKPGRLYREALVLEASLNEEAEAMPFKASIKPVYWAGLLLIIAVPFAVITRVLVGNEARSRRNIALPLEARAGKAHPVAIGR